MMLANTAAVDQYVHPRSLISQVVVDRMRLKHNNITNNFKKFQR